MRPLLFAPPGAGKGTQGERLAAWSGARHIAAGDLLRAEARAADKADVIRHRLQVFAETTGPLVPYYTERGILVAVDVDRHPTPSRPTSRPGCPGSPCPAQTRHGAHE